MGTVPAVGSAVGVSVGSGEGVHVAVGSGVNVAVGSGVEVGSGVAEAVGSEVGVLVAVGVAGGVLLHPVRGSPTRASAQSTRAHKAIKRIVSSSLKGFIRSVSPEVVGKMPV
jgi:hypothetical protein